MSQDIIAMAREAGMSTLTDVSDPRFIFVKRFAALVAAAEREACSKLKSGTPRELKPVGNGTLLDEQQYCFDKGWREGAASVRAAIRARGETK